MLSFLISFFSLGLIVLLHEMGHFFLARRFGIKVEEFGFGFPPRIFSFEKKGVIYSCNAIPFGGFVKILEHNGANSFSAQSLGKRTLILLAGVTNNVLIAFLLFTVLFSLGMPCLALPENYEQNIPSAVIIKGIEKESPAFTAGLKPEDIILGIKYSEGGSYYAMTSIEGVQNKVAELKGKEIQLIIQRQGESMEITITPRESLPEGKGYLGVILSEDGVVKYSLFKAPGQSIRFMGFLTREMFIGLKRVFINLFIRGDIKELTGPIGTVAITSRGFQWGWNYGLYILGLISYAFAIFNLLPIPAVDGGRILFLIIEKVRQRPMTQRTEALVNNISFSLLIILLFFVTINDINFFILNPVR